MIKEGNEGVGVGWAASGCPIAPGSGDTGTKGPGASSRWKGPSCRNEQLKQEGRVYGEHPPKTNHMVTHHLPCHLLRMSRGHPEGPSCC